MLDEVALRVVSCSRETIFIDALSLVNLFLHLFSKYWAKSWQFGVKGGRCDSCLRRAHNLVDGTRHGPNMPSDVLVKYNKRIIGSARKK